MSKFHAKAQRRKEEFRPLHLPLRLCAFARNCFLLLIVATVSQAQTKPADYVRSEAMIPMRDGVRLYTQIDAPKDPSSPLPILLLRTPYGLGDLKSEQIATLLSELSADGYIIVRQDIRGRFKSFEKPEALTANVTYHYQIPFPANDHTFKKGHRIMVQVQSTWFPVIDRNPQQFVPNIFLASRCQSRPGNVCRT